MTRLRAAVPAVALLLVVAGCTSSPHPVDPSPTFSPDPQHSTLVARAGLDPCPASSSAVGGGLPDITLPCLGDGPAVHLSGLRGTPTVVNIWGSWCGPCQKEAPYFAKTYAALKGRVRVLGVDDEDSPNGALDFAAHLTPRMRYPSVVDQDKKVLLGLHGPIAVPSTVFVDASGAVVKQVSVAYDSVAQLEADIARYLKVQP